MPLNEAQREQIIKDARTADGPAWQATSRPIQFSILSVLISIDERLERMEQPVIVDGNG